MAIIGFQESKGGLWRHVIQDLVGGRDLQIETVESPPTDEQHVAVQKWWWKGPDQTKLERLATVNVADAAPTGPPWTDQFPPDGGVGIRARAQWAWYPQVGSEDELSFPKGAEVWEVVDVNGDWFFGCYMGAKGLFPAPYVKNIEG